MWFIWASVPPQLNQMYIVWPLLATKFMIRKDMCDVELLDSFPLTLVRPVQSLGKSPVLTIITNFNAKSF